MEVKEGARISKGIVFAGCSFTWGQGLYYYRNLPTLKEPAPDAYDSRLLTSSHIRFMKSVRYPRLVANHFNTFECVYPGNGGSNEGAIEWWERCFASKGPGERCNDYHVDGIDYKEISYVVFQLTQWQREHFVLQNSKERHDIAFHQVSEPPLSDMFSDYLEENNITLEDWLELYKKKGLDNVKRFLMDCENNGVKTLLFTWPPEYVELIENDEWLKERFITFEYNGNSYSSIDSLMDHDRWNPKGNPELTIKWDTESFEETPKDHHPSLKCHQVMAENVINRIERDLNK
jgi:hypothetical protein